jgi:hypothetical protein
MNPGIPNGYKPGFASSLPSCPQRKGKPWPQMGSRRHSSQQTPEDGSHFLNSWGFHANMAFPAGCPGGSRQGQCSGKEARVSARGPHYQLLAALGSHSGSKARTKQWQEWLEGRYLNQDQKN